MRRGWCWNSWSGKLLKTSLSAFSFQLLPPCFLYLLSILFVPTLSAQKSPLVLTIVQPISHSLKSTNCSPNDYEWQGFKFPIGQEHIARTCPQAPCFVDFLKPLFLSACWVNYKRKCRFISRRWGSGKAERVEARLQVFNAKIATSFLSTGQLSRQ